MADAPPPPQHTPERSPNRNPPPVPEDANQRYWCFSCQRNVMVDREGGEILCGECRNGFVEAIVVSSEESVELADDDVVASVELMSQMLRFITEADGDGDDDEDVVQPLPMDHLSSDEEDEDDDVYEDDDDDDYDDDDDGEEQDEGEEELETEDSTELIIENDENSGGGGVDGHEWEEDELERRAEVVRPRLRDIVSRLNSIQTRFSDWAEITLRLENRAIELGMHLPETDEYFGNPEDYVDAAGYEALLQNLAENDQSGRRGAPAAAKASVAELPTVVIADDGYEACAICKEGVSVGDSIKKMPCGHGYHEDCIVPWLESRNSCPVCRYELPTDDPEYEEERKKKLGASASRLT